MDSVSLEILRDLAAQPRRLSGHFLFDSDAVGALTPDERDLWKVGLLRIGRDDTGRRFVVSVSASGREALEKAAAADAPKPAPRASWLRRHCAELAIGVVASLLAAFVGRLVARLVENL